MFRFIICLSLFCGFHSAHAEEKMVEFIVSEHFKSISNATDILIVMDTSMSMNFFMKDIPLRWKSFLSPLEENKIDFQLGFIDSNTDEEEKTLIPFQDGEYIIHNYSENSNQMLIDFLESQKCKTFPFCGGRRERPLGSLVQYLKTQSSDGLIREYTDKLFVLIFTDSNESKKERSDTPTTSEEVLDVFGRYFPQKELVVHTFTVIEDICRDKFTRGLLLSLFGEGFRSKNGMELSQNTGGDVFSLCLENYQIASQNILEKVHSQ